MMVMGYWLMELEIVKDGVDCYYWFIWVKSDLGYYMECIDGWKSFIEQKCVKVKEGYVMGEVEGIVLIDNEQQFYGVWYKGDIQYKVWCLDFKEGIMKKIVEMFQNYFYLVDLDVFEIFFNIV